MVEQWQQESRAVENGQTGMFTGEGRGATAVNGLRINRASVQVGAARRLAERNEMVNGMLNSENMAGNGRWEVVALSGNSPHRENESIVACGEGGKNRRYVVW